jgi:hypothetical protein
MAYCYKCGVELDRSAERCPLCSTPVPCLSDDCDGDERAEEGLEAGKARAYPDFIIDPQNKYNLTGTERRRIAIEIISFSFILGAAIIVLADLLDGNLGWSLFGAAALACAWVLVAGVVWLWKRPLGIVGCATLSLAAFLVVIDLLAGGNAWSIGLGLPILLSAAGLLVLTLLILRLSKSKGFDTVAHCLLAFTIFLLSVEAIIDLHLRASVHFSWSLITALSLTPLAVVLYYVNARVLHGADLRKFFRL